MVETLVGQEVLDALKNIGLNLYERKLYIAILSKGKGTAGDLAEMAGVPRSRAYDVLESLAEKGFVVVQHSKPLTYVAVPPKTALLKQKEILKDRFNRMSKRLDAFAKSPEIEELEKLHKEGIDYLDPSDLSGAFKGQYTFHMQLDNMLRNATKNIDMILTPKTLRNIWNHHADRIYRAASRGVKVRIAVPFHEDVMDIIEALSEIAEVRDLSRGGNEPLLHGRMIVVDGDQALLGLTNDEETHASQDIAFWTHSDHFAEDFSGRVFDLVWDHLEETPGEGE